MRGQSGRRRDHNQVDQVLDARALDGPRLPIAPRVGVQFLGDMVLQGQRRDADGRDPGEGEEIGPNDRVHGPRLSAGRRGTKPDIHGHMLECPAGELGVNVVAHGRCLAERIKAIRTLDTEDDVVAKVTLLGGEQIAGGSIGIIVAPEVHVHGGAGVDAKAKIEG